MNDEARRFRFVIPPAFFVASLLLGLYYSDFDFLGVLGSLGTEKLVALAGLAAASAVPVGYLLTSISLILLRGIFRLFSYTYEIVLPPKAWNRIWPLLKTDLQTERKWHLYAAATFDHEMLRSETHAWIQRRWSTFHVSAHSCTAVIVSHIAALFGPVRETWGWVLWSVGAVVILGLSAWIAWRHTMQMIEFQSGRSPCVFEKEKRIER